METEDQAKPASAGSEDQTANDDEAPHIVSGLRHDMIQSAIRACVGLISLPVDPDTLHATLRLTLRLTRDHYNAVYFAELGGPKLLLGLTQASAFQGFTSLVTLILRHVMEEENTLMHTMEKVRSADWSTF